MKLQSAIVYYRAENGLSMSKFAKMCGLSPQTIYKLEALGTKPSRTTKAKIMMVLGGKYYVDQD
jgi:DNA-binding XRE family transcriptional regulator